MNIFITMLLGGLWHGAAWHSSSGARTTARASASGRTRRNGRSAAGHRRLATRGRSGASSAVTFHARLPGLGVLPRGLGRDARSRCSGACSPGGTPRPPWSRRWSLLAIALMLALQFAPHGARPVAQERSPRLRPGGDGRRARGRPVRRSPRSDHRAWRRSSTSSSDDPTTPTTPGSTDDAGKAPDGVPVRPAATRMPAGRVLVVMLVCLLPGRCCTRRR